MLNPSLVIDNLKNLQSSRKPSKDHRARKLVLFLILCRRTRKTTWSLELAVSLAWLPQNLFSDQQNPLDLPGL
jgi:hypothetical protein